MFVVHVCFYRIVDEDIFDRTQTNNSTERKESQYA